MLGESLNRPDPAWARWAWAPALLIVGSLVLFVAPRDGRALTATDIDALAAGGLLAGRLAADGAPLKERLAEGFAPVEDHPKAKTLSGKREWRQHVMDAPLTRWAVAASILLSPHDGTDLERSRMWAAVLGLLAVLLGGLLAGPGAAWRFVGGLLVLAAPGLADALHGTSAAALTAGVVALHLLAGRRFLAGRRGGLVATGLTWGLLLGLHPVAAALVVPLFVAAAVAWRPPEGPPRQPGDLPLPSVPAGLFLAPVLALAVLVLMWPSLWSDTGRRVGAWLTDAWWLRTEPHAVLGVAWDQAAERAAPAWAGLVGWLAWTPTLVVAAWAAGVHRAVREGRAGDWYPILLLATVLAVASVDGGLFGARGTLLPWLWVPTAITAARGLQHLSGWLLRVWPEDRRPRLAAAIVVLAVLAVPTAGALAGVLPASVARGGAAALRIPIPVHELAALADADPGARVHIVSGRVGYWQAVQVLRRHAELDLRWVDVKAAERVWVVDDGSPRVTETRESALAGAAATHRVRAGGLAFDAYARTPPRRSR